VSAPAWPLFGVFAMAMTSAEKMRRHRARAKRERVVLQVEVDPAFLSVALVNGRYLHQDLDGDREQLGAALARALDDIVNSEQGFPVTGHLSPVPAVRQGKHEVSNTRPSRRRGRHADHC